MRLFYLPLLGLCLLLKSCVSPTQNPAPGTPPVSYRPILMSRQQLETSVAGQPPRALQVPGKIFISNRYLFVNELYQGIHIYDNADPAKPTEVQFLRIPGNVDLAVRGSLLYADNGPDLVVIDIGDPAQARVVGRTRNALPELAAPIRNFSLPAEYQPANRPANSVIVGWEKR
ncbi:hypothetical protein AUC43_01295 [Hymenobacter sedentarius]|uniref:LVIVD repeat-containing protein n=1 Tax=Hymenobacter sedentarius TaxID=1411621 RepID=A0A0U4AJU9_9BACT|nr:hypothetical protein [Hymenobacter sedentarius]ALW83856.1 hypothetical protein AUC43_01295 [Hymenobacter sedentarius]